tara:strand:+ start:403 stop:951 length:549 start_codon:yes stop_codon:yes gene_type:complete
LENHNDMQGHDEHEEHQEGDTQFSGHQIDELHSKELLLSPVELLTIDDGLSLLVNKNEFDGAVALRPIYPSAGIGCSIDLISKIGEAILRMSECLEKPVSQTITVTDVDIFVLRELVISQVVKMDRSVALGLRLKLYALLYSDNLKVDALNKSLDDLLEISNKDGKLGKVLDAFKAQAEYEN